MVNAIEVSDSLSNAEEQIERAARVVGKGARRKVFEAIYHHKMKVKSASHVVKRTKLGRIRVLQEARHLCRHGIVKSAFKDGETAYEMISFFHSHKAKILRCAANPKELAKVPTKRRPAVTVKVTGGRNTGASSRPSAKKISIDDIDSFSAVKKVKADGNLPDSISETAFKQGVQAILREGADWKDWGGELFDLATMRVVFKGKRIPAVIAFKGPGTKGALVPGKMGKNGDQIPRMFLGDGRLFIVQYWRDIKPSVDSLMRSMSIDKSNATGEKIYYAVVDGADSHRLYRAYKEKFTKKPGRETRKR